MTLTGEIPPNVVGYRNVDLVWTLADSRRARREGWDLFHRHPLDGEGFEIQPTQVREVYSIIFRTDLNAIEHCMVMADVSGLHARALALHFHSLALRGR